MHSVFHSATSGRHSGVWSCLQLLILAYVHSMQFWVNTSIWLNILCYVKVSFSISYNLEVLGWFSQSWYSCTTFRPYSYVRMILPCWVYNFMSANLVISKFSMSPIFSYTSLSSFQVIGQLSMVCTMLISLVFVTVFNCDNTFTNILSCLFT